MNSTLRTFQELNMRVLFRLILLTCCCGTAGAEEFEKPLVRVVDLNIGESQEVTLHNNETCRIKVLDVREKRDQVMHAIRQIEVDVKVNGQKATMISGLYRLPRFVGGVQIDCPVTANYNRDSHVNHWGIVKDVRFRLWPKDSDWIHPNSFVYPVGQRWFASQTWFSNEAVSARSGGKFYYHAGLDLGASEYLTPVFAATDGRVVSVAGNSDDNLPKAAVQPRYDVIYLQDKRGWYYRYSHLSAINTPVQLGATVKAGQQIGVVGKEGGSGGWTHLHFEIKSLQPSGQWGTQDGYAFLWQANREQFSPEVVAVARPRYLVLVDETVRLDASRSWSKTSQHNYHWDFGDGTAASGETAERVYRRPGVYNEILTVTDANGNSDVDFAVVKVVPPGGTWNSVPIIHATYHPSIGIRAGDPIVFKVRARYTSEGLDVWDYGDGSPTETVRSNTDPSTHAREGIGYANTVHRFQKPGRYIVTVRRATSLGTATDRLVVRVE